MVPALLLALGCWRPDAYEPPDAPPEAREAVEALADEAGAAEEGPEDEVVDGAPDAEEAVAAEPEEDEPPPFPAYEARTLQAPVTLVDDYGKLLAVIDTVGFVLEVRGEEEVRTRVSCATCTPPVEGWIQAHLVTRTGSSPTGGSK